jgi:cell division transport system permease protein
MNYLSQHLSAFNSALRRLLATPVASLLNIFVIGIAISLPAGLFALMQNAQGLMDQSTGKPQISVFLSLGASAEDVKRTSSQLKQLGAIDRVEYVSREAALEQMKRSTGLSDVIGGLAQNPLPDAFVVYPRSAAPDVLEALRAELSKWPRVDKVQLDSAWVLRLEAMLKFGRRAAAVAAALLGVALVAVTFNTIRLQILTRRDEIEVAGLIGATRAFIRRPFLYLGLLQGLLGGMTAWLIVSASFVLLDTSLAELMALYASSFTLRPLGLANSLVLLFVSAALGWMGAWLSASQHVMRQKN